LTLDMSKYETVCQKKVDFGYAQIWLWVCLSKEKLILDISKYNIFKRIVEFRYVQIWLWIFLLKETKKKHPYNAWVNHFVDEYYTISPIFSEGNCF
jgi:hypothetical protein